MMTDEQKIVGSALQDVARVSVELSEGWRRRIFHRAAAWRMYLTCVRPLDGPGDRIDSEVARAIGCPADNLWKPYPLEDAPIDVQFTFDRIVVMCCTGRWWARDVDPYRYVALACWWLSTQCIPPTPCALISAPTERAVSEMYSGRMEAYAGVHATFMLDRAPPLAIDLRKED